jgi:hypothetical protein
VIGAQRLTQAFGTLMLTLAVAGCGGDGIPPGQLNSFCAGVGYAHSVVSVNGEELFARHPGGPLNVYECVEGRCTGGHFKVWSDRPDLVAGLSGFHVDSTRRANVHFTAVSRGRIVFDGRTTVRLHPAHPNGKGCPPTTWFAQVSAHGDGALRQDRVTYAEMYGQ